MREAAEALITEQRYKAQARERPRGGGGRHRGGEEACEVERGGRQARAGAYGLARGAEGTINDQGGEHRAGEEVVPPSVGTEKSARSAWTTSSGRWSTSGAGCSAP